MTKSRGLQKRRYWSETELELLKARRAPVYRWGAAALVLGVPGVALLFLVLARAGGSSTGAAKAAALLPDVSLAGLVGLAGQVLTVATLLAAGTAAAWTFGREFVDDAFPALFAVATPRRKCSGSTNRSSSSSVGGVPETVANPTAVSASMATVVAPEAI